MRSDNPADLFDQQARLGELVKHRPRLDENGLQFLTRLRGSTTPEEAVTFTAFSALPVAAIGWGYECLRMMADHLDPSERPVMHQISDWLNEPSTTRRHAIMRSALWAPMRTPSVLLALSVGWAAGGPAPNDPEPSPAHKTPVAINSAVLSCLARAQLRQRPVYMARFLDMAETLFRAY
ncbi:MAG: hypothetical protein DI616_01830 [Paracoccus denitrificans]|uniref:Uncharacterized protein n=1 Tax=Paracoccus denitrificans TaxID=266 RepID=A0A533ICM4_PARDE|nr:MAG: hypothetical protein DI616_01830 [Paracoccus denitrificans]